MKGVGFGVYEIVGWGLDILLNGGGRGWVYYCMTGGWGVYY